MLARESGWPPRPDDWPVPRVVAVRNVKALPLDIACTVSLRVAETGGVYRFGRATMRRDRAGDLWTFTLLEQLRSDINAWAAVLPREKREGYVPLAFMLTLEPSYPAACDDPTLKAYWPRPIRLRPMKTWLTAPADGP